MTEIATQGAATGRLDPLADLLEELDVLRRDALVSSEHTTEQLQVALDVFARVGRELHLVDA